MYIYHPRRVFLAGYGWFEANILYLDTQIRVYHIWFITTEDFDGMDLILL